MVINSKCPESLKIIPVLADKARVNPRAYLLLILLPAIAWAKPNLAGLGLYENHGAVCERLYSEVAGEAKPKGYDKLERLRKRFAEFRGINEQDNLQFIKRAKQANAGLTTEAKLYLDIENAVLKELNDKVIQDRELVTVLTNLHKDVVWQAISDDAVLSAALLDKYSDFKSLRFAFKENSPELQARAAKVLADVNKKYSDYLADLAAEKGWKERVQGISADARNWYHGGVGLTPDQAGLATRFSRDNLGPDGVARLRAFKEAAPELQQAAFNSAKMQKWVSKRFEGIAGFLAVTPGGKKVISAETIEAIKKTSVKAGETPAEVIARVLSARFNTVIKKEEAIALEKYVGLANSFSPGLLQAKREVVDMSVAAKGVISADFKGQNARNLEETMKALADTEGQHLLSRISAVRKGEEAATAILDTKKENFRRAMDSFLAELVQKKVITAAESKKVISQFSGDDGTTFVPFALTPEIRELAQEHLLKKMAAEDARVAFVPFDKPGAAVSAEARSEWIVAAEGVEKKLRSELTGKIPREELNGLQIAVHLAPEANGKAVAELHLAKKGGTVSSEEAQKVLAQAEALGYRARIIGNP